MDVNHNSIDNNSETSYLFLHKEMEDVIVNRTIPEHIVFMDKATGHEYSVPKKNEGHNIYDIKLRKRA